MKNLETRNSGKKISTFFGQRKLFEALSHTQKYKNSNTIFVFIFREILKIFSKILKFLYFFL